MEVDERSETLPKGSHRRHLAVERAAAATVRADPARHDRLLGPRFGEPALDDSRRLSGSHCPCVGALAQQQLERTDESRLSGARLAGHDGHARWELEPDLFDERKVLDVELLDHRAPPKNSSATVW